MRKEVIADATLCLSDCIEGMQELADGSVQTCVTSPPYFGLRDYGHDDQIGLEDTPDAFVARLVEVFREVRRVLTDDGTLWLNLGDSYANDGKWGGSSGGKHVKALHGDTGVGRQRVTTGLKPKNLIGIPWRVAFALQADGWYLRQDIIWHKPNPMPESVKDRCTKAHEYIFLLSKSPHYYFDADAIKEIANCGAKGSEFHTGKTGEHQNGRAQKIRPSAAKGSFAGKTEAMAGSGQNAFRAVTETRNKRSVWTVTTKAFKGAHFAVFPPDLIEPCILAGSRSGDLVLDPFTGSGTTGMVAGTHGRKFYGCELNAKYHAMAEERISAAYAQRRLFV